jgi:hypothetical protein
LATLLGVAATSLVQAQSDALPAERSINFYITTTYVNQGSLILEGFNLKNESFSIQIDKSEPQGPLSIEQIVSSEGSFAVHDGQYLWRVDVIVESADPKSSLAERFADRSTKAIPDHDFPYHQHGLSPIVFAQITGAIVAKL